MRDIVRRAPGEARDDAGRPPASRRDLRPRAPSCNISGVGRVFASRGGMRRAPRRGVAARLALTVFLACIAAANSSRHHDTSVRGAHHAEGGSARRHRHRSSGTPTAEFATSAIVEDDDAPVRPRRVPVDARLGEIDVERFAKRAREIEEAAFDEPRDDDVDAGIFGLDDDSDVAEDPAEVEEEEEEEEAAEEHEKKKHGKKKRDDEADEDVSPSASLEATAAAAVADADAAVAAIDADVRRLDADFPELVGYTDDASARRRDEEEAAASAAFHEKQEREEMAAMRGDVAEVSDEKTTRRERRRRRRRDDAETDAESASDSSDADASSDSTDALIDLLTRRAPPPPPGAAVASGGFPLVVAGATAEVPDSEKSLDGWELTWSDEFDGEALDPSKWTARSNASAPGLEWVGGQQQWYDPGECRVVGGALAIRTRRREGDFFFVPGAARTRAEEYPFVSCWVDTERTFTQTYGRVEIRAKFPDHSCPGVWPQHWMLPHPETSVPRRACWPLGGEIDIASAYGRGRGGPGARAGVVESGYHFAPKGECGVDGSAKSQYPSDVGTRKDFHSDFHVFAVEWDKNALRYFVDGVQTSELTSFHVPIIPRWPFYLILNTAVSPYGLPDVLDCDYDMYHYVDYVRVYRRVAKGAESRVWVFLASAAAGLVLVLALAACCAMRSALDDDERDDDIPEAKRARKRFPADDGDSDDGVDRGADDATVARALALAAGGYRRGAGPRRENLRLFDNAGFKRGGGRGAEWKGKGADPAESAPLIGGVALRLPVAARGRGAAAGPGLEGSSRASTAHLRSRRGRATAPFETRGFGEDSDGDENLAADAGGGGGTFTGVAADGRVVTRFVSDRAL